MVRGVLWVLPVRSLRSMRLLLRTIGCCCACGNREPLRQTAVSGVGFEFEGCHSLKQLVKVDVLAALNPLASGIDLAVCLDGCHQVAMRPPFRSKQESTGRVGKDQAGALH